jgi:hypothetical protein
LIRIKRNGRETYFSMNLMACALLVVFLAGFDQDLYLKAPIKSAQALHADIAHQVVFIQYLA